MTIPGFLSDLQGQQRAIGHYLVDWLDAFPELEGKIRWSVPVYTRKKQICYIYPLKKDGMELVFMRGQDMSNEAGLLQYKNRKQVAGIEFFHIAEIPLSTINQMLQEAIIMDDL